MSTRERAYWHLILAVGAMVANACVDGKPAGGDSGPPPCPSDIESFCLYEFGGACPSFEDAAAMTCDGYHFDPTGTAAGAVSASGGDVDCPTPAVACSDEDDPNLRTRIYFTSTGLGSILWVGLYWGGDPECPGTYIIGDAIC